jgi:hypothetical protein
MTIWITGREIAHPPFEVPKDLLLRWVMAGRVVPYEEVVGSAYADPGEHPGYRRIVPLHETRDRLGQLRYRLKWAEDWLAQSDADHDAYETEIQAKCPSRKNYYVSPAERRVEIAASIPGLIAEVAELESALDPATAWSCFGDLDGKLQGHLIHLLTTTAVYSKEQVVAAAR